MAYQTVRLTSGRGKELATHTTMMVYAANDPLGMGEHGEKASSNVSGSRGNRISDGGYE